MNYDEMICINLETSSSLRDEEQKVLCCCAVSDKE